MIEALRALLATERQLKTVWRVTRGRARSYLVGTAHFFPYRFHAALRRLIGQAETVLLEGPLDQESMRKVAEAGSKGDEGFSLDRVLDARTIARIQKGLERQTKSRLSSHALYRGMFDTEPDELGVSGLRPWMAFFQIWTRYRERHGWKFTMDLDAFRIATGLGKEVRFLETIDEQIEALDGVPVERIVNFLRKIDEWKGYRRAYVRGYLRGELDGLMGIAREFPTFCESIIDRRDPVLYERMRRFLKRGNTVAFVGVVHCPGIRARLLEDGFVVTAPDVSQRPWSLENPTTPSRAASGG